MSNHTPTILETEYVVQDEPRVNPRVVRVRTSWFSITPERNVRQARCRIGCMRELAPGEGFAHYRPAGPNSHRCIKLYGCPACTDRVLEYHLGIYSSIALPGYKMTASGLIMTGGELTAAEVVGLLESQS